MSDYRQDAEDDAKETILKYIDDIVEQLKEKGAASDDLFNDYDNDDAWHHESHVDRCYGLLEAAELLDQLSDHIEEDSGLWENLEPRQAIGTQAAFTYGNAVFSAWIDLIETINDEYFSWEAEDEEDRDDLDDAIRAWIN